MEKGGKYQESKNVIMIKEGEEAKQKEITKAMLNEKIPIELISKITGLSKEEIEQLK